MQFPVHTGNNKEDCPPGWIHVPHLFYELYWNTPLFKDRWTPNQGYQPFVLANGDVTGFSLHGDFIAGWDNNVLQDLISNCDKDKNPPNHGDGLDSCTAAGRLNKDDDKCHIPNPSPEKVDGVLSALPGNNPLFGWWNGNGGSSALPTKPTNSPTSTSSPTLSPSPSPSDGGKTASGWKYAGCYQDTGARVINGEPYVNIDQVSNTNCAAHCQKGGWTISGTEYAGQCFCGNTINGAQKLAESACNMKCKGDSNEVCGGPNALSVYSKTGSV